MNGKSLTMASACFASVLSPVECSHGQHPIAVDDAMECMLDLLVTLRHAGGSVFIIGNGGSAAVAAHIQNDLVKKGTMRAQVLHEASMMTCMSNDFGYDQAFARMIGIFAHKGDLLIAISSSGQSNNIRQAAEHARQVGCSTVTLTGFKPGNPLRQAGDLNFWCPSDDYGEVEVAHLFLLHYLADCLAGRS